MSWFRASIGFALVQERREEALIMEAIPGLYVYPFWVLVVGAVALWGTARPKLDG